MSLRYNPRIITTGLYFYLDAEDINLYSGTGTISAGIYTRRSIYQEGMTEYTHEEILELVSGEEWIPLLSDRE